jgi:hypothetical protein
MRRLLHSILVIICLLNASHKSFAGCEDTYYLLVFGSNTRPKRPEKSHTFGSLIHARGDGCHPSEQTLDVYTISWMPADMDITLLRPIPEKGGNLSLASTFDWITETNQETAVFGPIKVKEKIFLLGMQRLNELQSGKVTYQCIDPMFRIRSVADCIHALTDLDVDHGRLRYPVLRFGQHAAEHFAKMMMKHGSVELADEDADWMLNRIGLDCYPIIKKPIPEIQRDSDRRIDRALERARLRQMDSLPSTDFVVPAGCSRPCVRICACDN